MASLSLVQLPEHQEPLYRTVSRTIAERIAAGEYAAGKTLPPEPELGREFGVSRVTIRQALGLLKQQGLLHSRPGLGTVVRRSSRGPVGMRMTGTLQDLINYGAATKYHPVDRAIVTAPIDVAGELDIDPAAAVVRFRGLRSRSGELPFGFEEVYIPERLGTRVGNRNLGGRTLFSVLEEVSGLRIVDARQAITAVSAPALVSRHLGLRSGASVLRVTRSYRTTEHAVEVAVSHYDPAKFEYVMTLYRA